MRTRWKCDQVESLMADVVVDGKPVLDDNKQQKQEKHAERVYFSPVYSPEPTSENAVWAKGTPAGKLWMQIDNPDAFGHYTAGQEYFWDAFLRETAPPAPVPAPADKPAQ